MLTIKDSIIRVFKSDSPGSYDFEIDGERAESMELSRRINRRKDEGTLVLNNDDGTFSQSDREITLGDRVDVYAAPQQAPLEWGEDHSGWGYGGWGGYRLLWSGWVKDPSYVRVGPTTSNLVLKGHDYVFSVLSNRITFDAFEDRKIAGSSDAILETIVSREAPEIDLSLVHDVPEKTSITAEGVDLLELCIKLARRADCVLYAYKNKLVFAPLTDLSPEFTVDPSDDIGTFENALKGGTVKNVIRVDGGTDHAIDDEQTTQDGYATATESSRVTFQISTRKSQLERIELWTRTTGSNESITVRVQKDDGGAPVAPNDEQSDVDSQQLSYEFISSDGFTSFLMNDHTLPEPNPWVLVETDGPDGQDVGVDTATGTPAYKAHYPFPVSVQIRDGDSIERHTRIEKRIKQKNLNTLDAARELATETRDNFNAPEADMEFPATSRRTHRLDPGEIITLDMARERAVGDYLVTEMDETFTDNQYYADVKAQEIESV